MAASKKESLLPTLELSTSYYYRHPNGQEIYLHVRALSPSELIAAFEQFPPTTSAKSDIEPCRPGDAGEAPVLVGSGVGTVKEQIAEIVETQLAPADTAVVGSITPSVKLEDVVAAVTAAQVRAVPTPTLRAIVDSFGASRASLIEEQYWGAAVAAFNAATA